MKVLSLNKKPDNTVTAIFEIESEEYEPYLRKSSEIMQKAKPIDGYRVGKAPVQVAVKHYGEALFTDATQKAVPHFYEQLCQENDLAPITDPVVTVVRSDENGAEVMVKFENYPEVEYAEYKGVKVTRYVQTCTEADIDEAIEKYMNNHLWVHEVPREARMGDIVEVKFKGTHNGERFPYDHSNKSRFTMGSGTLFAGLDEALLGHVANDELKLSLTMPEDFHRENVAGMTLDLEVFLVGVWARDRLECTDEYVRDNVKVGNCNSVSEFREYQRKEIQHRYDTRSDYLFRQATDIAIGNILDCDVPESMVQVSLQKFKDTLKATAAGQGMTVEQALEKDGLTMDGFVEMCRPYAIEKVKMSLLLDYVVRQENITVEPNEFASYIESKAKEYNKSADELKNNPRFVEDAYEKLLNSKAEKLIKNNLVEVIENVDKLPEKLR